MLANFDVTPSFLFMVLLACNQLQPSKTQVDCNDFPCFNGGTCMRGFPDMCSCPGFVQPFCTRSCQNMQFSCLNGVCAGDVCNCPSNFAGPTCASAIAAYLNPWRITVIEGHVGLKAVTVQVCRQPSSEEVTLAVYTSASSALPDVDFVEFPFDSRQDVTISAGQTCTSVNVFIISDLIQETMSEVFYLNLYDPQPSSSSSSMVHIVNGNGFSSITITDDDPDTEPPTIHNCPDDITVTAPAGAAATTVSWTPPTATDSSGAVTPTSLQNPGDSFTIGSTQVTYTANDGADNIASCRFLVTVVADDDECASLGTNMCDSSSSTCMNIIGSYICMCKSGYTGLPYTPPGQQPTCTADVTPPVIFGCPSNILYNVEIGTPGTSVSWTELTATDNSGTATLVSQSNSPGFFPVGTTTVTYIYVDPAGNEAVCTFDVIVQEDCFSLYSAGQCSPNECSCTKGTCTSQTRRCEATCSVFQCPASKAACGIFQFMVTYS